jgi:hypothetical protein
MTTKDTVNVRIGRDKAALIKDVASRHPLKPTLRAAIERAIELMVEDFEEEIKNAKR